MDTPLGPLWQLSLACHDLRQCIGFYRDTLGLTLLAEFAPPGIAFFRLGHTRLMIEQQPEQAGKGSVLYFQVSDIHAVQRALEARGVAFSGQPQRIHRDEAGHFGPPGNEEWMTFFKDPDGNQLALAEQRTPV